MENNFKSKAWFVLIMVDKSEKVMRIIKILWTDKANLNFDVDGSNMNPLMKRKPIHHCTFLSGNKDDLCYF